MSEPDYEMVYTVTDYHDGPVEGMADYLSHPHLYSCRFNEDSDRYEDFLLIALDQRHFDLELESWAIWKRWEITFHEGRTTIDTHPALPEDRDRHKLLKTTARTFWDEHRRTAKIATGDFHKTHETSVDDLSTGWQVRWTTVQSK